MNLEQWVLGACPLSLPLSLSLYLLLRAAQNFLDVKLSWICRSSGDGMVDRKTNDHIVIIETFLSKLNKGQGPGFVLFGKVVSKTVLITVASKIAAYSSLVIQALTSLQVDAVYTATIEDTAATELAGLQTGSYNLTLTNSSITIGDP